MGLLDESGLLTPTRIALRQAIEDRTDQIVCIALLHYN
jgi:hypothetical protein